MIAATHVGANVKAGVVWGGGDSAPPSRVKHTWQGYSGGWVGVRVRPPKNLADTFLHIGASSRPSPWLVLWPSVPDTHVINALRRFRAAPTFAAFGAPRFVRVASGQLVDSKTRNRAHASRPRSGALSTTRRAIGLSRATQSSSTPAVSHSGRRPRCPARERFGPTTRPGGGNDPLRLSMVLGSLLLLRT